METKKQNTSKYLNILNIYIYHWIGLREMLQESSTNLMGKTGKTMAGWWYKIGSSSQLLGKTKNVPNNQPVIIGSCTTVIGDSELTHMGNLSNN
jgi:hypothetical protein